MRRPRWDDEGGSALIMTIGIGFVLLIVASTLITSSLAGFRGSVTDERWHAALAAADAGVEDYLYRLNQDGNYWRWDETNPPPEGNPAMTGQAPVPGASNPATFQYTPDTSDLASQGTVRLRSRGTVGDQSREVEVTLRRRSFLDYLYFTDLETRDPALYPSSSRDWAQNNCTRYAWGDNPRHGSCTEITFYQGPGFTDRIHGPLHTNDRMRIRGKVEFNGDTSSSYPLATDDDDSPTCPPERYLDAGGGDPVFANSCDPSHAPALKMPPNNQRIRIEADHTRGKDGCLFTGPTKIELGDGRMRVDSPFTKDSGCTGTTPDQWQPLPDNGVIYVQAVPGDSGDSNWSPGCPGGHPFEAELANGDGTASNYGCRDGDAFLWGELDGQVTVAAENNINLVWDMTVEDPHGDDILGLVADNNVQVYHPLSEYRRVCGFFGCWDQKRDEPVNVPPLFHDLDNDHLWEDVTVHAAILSVRHSFMVSDYEEGDPLGTLNVTGAIAQKYRGPVGQFNTGTGGSTSGYEKNYVYDDRLRYLSPPHFLDPVDSAWQVSTWSEGVVGD